MKTKIVKIAALVLALVMIAGVCACAATDNNPSIGSVGKVKFRLSDYMQYYQQYSSYASYISDFNGFIKNQLINYGVTLNHCYEEGITLDESEEAELATKVQESIDSAVSSMTLDSTDGLTDEQIAAAKLDKFIKQLKDAGYRNLDQYRKLVEEETRKDMLIDKLRELVNAEVEFGSEQVQKYYDDNVSSDEEKYKDKPSEFANAYNSYITSQAAAPLFVPDDMFTVKHCLVQFANQDKVSDEVEGEFGEDEQKKLEDIRKALNDGITLEDFIANFVSSADYNSDTIFVPKEPAEGEEPETVETNPQVGYREHGYIMNEKLLSKYYDGFGAAACLLKYGEDWTIPVEETEEATPAPDATEAPDAEPTETPEPEPAPIEKYNVVFHETTDGHKIAEVQTNVAGGGVHFIFIAEELEPGTVELDINDTESPVYKSIAKFYRQELENTHYSDLFAQWKENTKVRLNDSYIDAYAKNYLGIK
ncbi:MAG: hypothetical protein IJM85_02190 [Clostridia bacterium]|nr:hypothetical protein [Clostridia bacterium]